MMRHDLHPLILIARHASGDWGQMGEQVCIIDPTSAWWGLRLAADGKAKGLDIIILGGPHGDVPLSKHSGRAVASLVTQQGASVVCDTSSMTVAE